MAAGAVANAERKPDAPKPKAAEEKPKGTVGAAGSAAASGTSLGERQVQAKASGAAGGAADGPAERRADEAADKVMRLRKSAATAEKKPQEGAVASSEAATAGRVGSESARSQAFTPGRLPVGTGVSSLAGPATLPLGRRHARARRAVPRGLIQRCGLESCGCDGPKAVQRSPEQPPASSGGPVQGAGGGNSGQLVSRSGSGSPLPRATRSRAESLFGTDLSDVRIHTDGAAADSARMLRAQAFTTGSDVYFGDGHWRPDTHQGQRLIAHELAHVVQQRTGGAQPPAASSMVSSPTDPSERQAEVAAGEFAAGRSVDVGALSAGSGAPLQRYSWEEFKSDVGAAASAVGAAASEADHAVSEAVEGGIEAVEMGAEAAVSWVESQVGAAAIAAANALAGSFGGKVTIIGTTIRIDIPDIPLFDARQTPVFEIPRLALSLPIIAVRREIGPVIFGAGLFAELASQFRADAVLGPASIRRISILVDPMAGTASATGQLHVSASEAAAPSAEAGLDAEVFVIIVTPEGPIRIEGDVFGGLRFTLQITGVGSLDETVTLGYSSGAITLDTLTDLRLGASLDARLDAVAEANVEDLTVCEFMWPLKSWHWADEAEQFTFPLTIGFSRSGPSFSAGPVASKPIPMGDIEAALPGWAVQHSCKSMEEIVDYLCKKGILPAQICSSTTRGPVPIAPPGPMPVVPGSMPVVPGPSPMVPSGPKWPTGRNEHDPADHIPMTWFKPVDDRYYPSPILLDGIKYYRDNPALLAGEKIGVKSSLWPRLNKSIQAQYLTKDDKNRPEVPPFRRLLERHGFMWRTGTVTYDADHVQDILWHGPGHQSNLWPMESTANQAAGRRGIQQEVEYADVPSGPPVKQSIEKGLANPAAPYYLRLRWFKIRDAKAP